MKVFCRCLLGDAVFLGFFFFSHHQRAVQRFSHLVFLVTYISDATGSAAFLTLNASVSRSITSRRHHLLSRHTAACFKVSQIEKGEKSHAGDLELLNDLVLTASRQNRISSTHVAPSRCSVWEFFREIQGKNYLRTEVVSWSRKSGVTVRLWIQLIWTEGDLSSALPYKLSVQCRVKDSKPKLHTSTLQSPLGIMVGILVTTVVSSFPTL